MPILPCSNLSNFAHEMHLEKIHINPDHIAVDPAAIRKLMGNPADDLHTEALIEKYIAECRERLTPCGGYLRTRADLHSSGEVIELEGIRFSTGRIIPKMLGNAEEYALFVLTAGSGPESLARELIGEGHFLEGYIVDLIGSAMVEALADLVHMHIRHACARDGMKVSNRYSPGHCTWDVHEQQKLFRFFPAGFCGITLSGSSLMQPIKSASGLIGIGRKVAHREDICSFCSRKDCAFRRAAHTGAGASPR